MKINRLKVENFRGIRSAELLLSDHVVLIGDNNTGKSTILEAIDLVLGPDRLSRRPPIDEHDFYLGRYLSGGASAEAAQTNDGPDEETSAGDDAANATPMGDEAQRDSGIGDDAATAGETRRIRVEVTISALNDDQRARFRDYIEWWNADDGHFYTAAAVEGIDADNIVEALRVTFIGEYVEDEDDFEGRTYFARSLEESDAPQPFLRRDKQFCGFLYLRSLRTGTRALSLEHGSLLDIILRLKEIRPRMWESTISNLAHFDVAADPEFGISGVLESINAALNKYVPKEWGVEPHLRVSALTREHLRKVITAFIATGEGAHAAPYYRQGTGTINMLVLAMLSQIAEDKQNVIFAMEEPETAIPPYAQKRIIHEVRKLSAQSLFTSHSPYVLEEFALSETVALSRSGDGKLSQASVLLPDSVKQKRYRQEFRTRFCEGLLSRRILIAEGASEAAAFPAVARRLAELAPANYSPLEALGICTIDAGTDTQIADLAALYRGLGKTVYAACDKQDEKAAANISAVVDELFMHDEQGLEDLVLNNTTNAALERFCDLVTWPPHLSKKYPNPKDDLANAIKAYFRWSKGTWGVAEFLTLCTLEEIPEWLRDSCARLCELAQQSPDEPVAADSAETAQVAAAPVGDQSPDPGTAEGD